ncbi:MAG: MTAP family purine nucleoside phosphorylase [Candidatus Ornithospirochaeta sp.]
MKAIIGGTGIDKLSRDGWTERSIETEYGMASYMEKDALVVLLRHGKGHSLPPHRINYRANIEALSLLGVEKVVSLYCVGSINDKVPMGGVGILSDYMDFSGRNITFFDDEAKHTSVSSPFDESLSLRLASSLPEARRDIVYVTTNGPRFETASEVKAYGILGGDVIGMTGGTEFTLLAEKGIRFASAVYSINWCTGVEEKFSFSSPDAEEKLSERLFSAALEALSD